MRVITHGWEVDSASVADAGLVVFNDDPLSGPAVQNLLGPEVRLQVARIPFPAPNGPSLQMLLTAAAATILPSDPVPVIGFACTTGAVEIGEEGLRKAVARAGQDVVCCDPINAAGEALALMGIGRVAILCPYEEPDSLTIASAVAAGGIEVATLCYLSADNALIPKVSRETILGAARDAGEGVDALFISCTGLNATPLIDALEDALGIPVLTSLQVLAWQIARELARPIRKGPGRLFSQ